MVHKFLLVIIVIAAIFVLLENKSYLIGNESGTQEIWKNIDLSNAPDINR